MTAPTPERRVGEAVVRVEGERLNRALHEWSFCASWGDAGGMVHDLAHDLLDARCEGLRLRVEVSRLTAEVERLTNQKDGAYNERDHLVAALSKFFPASLERHPAEEEWDDDWRWIVFIELPTGQVSWHIHDSEVGYFAHLARETGRKWDGHSTPEKYARLAALSLPTHAPEARK